MLLKLCSTPFVRTLRDGGSSPFFRLCACSSGLIFGNFADPSMETTYSALLCAIFTIHATCAGTDVQNGNLTPSLTFFPKPLTAKPNRCTHPNSSSNRSPQHHDDPLRSPLGLDPRGYGPCCWYGLILLRPFANFPAPLSFLAPSGIHLPVRRKRRPSSVNSQLLTLCVVSVLVLDFGVVDCK